MRTSYTPQASPRSPHRYFTRLNSTPISPPSHREHTPPNLLDKRNNLFNQYRESPDNSDEELDNYTRGDAPSKLKSAYHFLRNLTLWVGLSFLSTNVYLLSQFRKLWVWRDPFLDQARPSTSSPYKATPRTPSHTTSPSSSKSEVGWCGFLAALLFLSALVLVLGVLMVPYPTSSSSSSSSSPSPSLFPYLEEQRGIVARVSELEAALQTSLLSQSELREAMSELERRRLRLEEEMVVIATLDRQQSGQIEGLHGLYAGQETAIQDMSVSLEELRSLSLQSELETLKQSLLTLQDLQSKLRRRSEEEGGRLEALEGAHGGTADRLGALAEEISTGIRDTRAEGRASLNAVAAKQAELEARIADLTTTFTDDKGHVESELLVQYNTKLEDMERKISHITSTQPKDDDDVTSDLISRLDTLSRDLATLRKQSGTVEQYNTIQVEVQEVRGALERAVRENSGAVKDVYNAVQMIRDKDSERDKTVTDELQKIESKISIISALQDRLTRLEDNGDVAKTREELRSLVNNLKDLDTKYADKIEQLESDVKQIISGTAVLKSELSGSLAANTADISTLKSDLVRLMTSLQHKLVELETNTSAKIRGIVLDVLASVSHGRPETRFFGDWLTANFLTREQFNREVKNDTDTLPSREELIQRVLSELNFKSSVDLNSGITTQDIRVIVNEALQTFDEDKTGRADFALEALGGHVISIGCTETYYEGAPYASFMSVPLYRIPNPPNVALQSDIVPGKCWAFKGNKGYLMIKLAHAVLIDGFSMEHLPRKLSLRNDISSAPNKFSVRGISHPEDLNPHHLGEFSFSELGPALQHFTVKTPSKVAYEIVEVEIESNHGNPEYTCLYRIRVHGKIPKLV